MPGLLHPQLFFPVCSFLGLADQGAHSSALPTFPVLFPSALKLPPPCFLQTLRYLGTRLFLTPRCTRLLSSPPDTLCNFTPQCLCTGCSVLNLLSLDNPCSSCSTQHTHLLCDYHLQGFLPFLKHSCTLSSSCTFYRTSNMGIYLSKIRTESYSPSPSTKNHAWPQ